MENFDVLQEAARVLRAEAKALNKASDDLGRDFITAVDLLHSAAPNGRVIVVGMGKSGHIGNKIAATLASTGTPAFSVHPAEAGHGDLGMITPNDVVLGISQSGKSDELLQILPYIKRHSIKLVAMTGNAKSPLGEAANIVIDTGVEQEACPLGLAPTTSTTLTLSLGDALAVCLLQKSGFDSQRFAETHPNGLLGRRLLVKVEDAMAPLERVGVVELGSTIKASLAEIARGEIGVVVIKNDSNEPIGVFTDGDLRRFLDGGNDISESFIDDYMTTDFTVIKRDALAIDAVNMMGIRSVLSLPVVDEFGKLVGLTDMKRLVSSGVV